MNPAGRSDRARTAADDDRIQFKRKTHTVKPRFAVRRSRWPAPATKNGATVSIAAPIAMTATMTVTFVANSRALIATSERIVASAPSGDADEFLIFLSASGAPVLPYLIRQEVVHCP